MVCEVEDGEEMERRSVEGGWCGGPAAAAAAVTTTVAA